MQINDQRELELPDVGLIQLEDEETGEQIIVDTSDEEFRRNYSKLVSKYNSSQKDLFRKLRIDSIELNSDDDSRTSLKRFFEMRKKRGVF